MLLSTLVLTLEMVYRKLSVNLHLFLAATLMPMLLDQIECAHLVSAKSKRWVFSVDRLLLLTFWLHIKLSPSGNFMVVVHLRCVLRIHCRICGAILLLLGFRTNRYTRSLEVFRSPLERRAN